MPPFARGHVVFNTDILKHVYWRGIQHCQSEVAAWVKNVHLIISTASLEWAISTSVVPSLPGSIPGMKDEQTSKCSFNCGDVLGSILSKPSPIEVPDTFHSGREPALINTRKPVGDSVSSYFNPTHHSASGEGDQEINTMSNTAKFTWQSLHFSSLPYLR